MADLPTGEVTILLRRMAEGCADAGERLTELVYAELRAMAARQLHGLRGQTLQPTALVHEAWLRLSGNESAYSGRQHFFGVAAKAMRSVLVDHLRRRRAEKRGGQLQRSSLDDTIAHLEADEVHLLDLDLALTELARDDADLVRWVEMRFFSGMSMREIAIVENCSESTIERGWRLARARLRHCLGRGAQT